MNSSFNDYIPRSLPLNGSRFIAPYWADTDLRGTGRIFYRQTNNPVLLAKATNQIREAFPSFQNVIVTNLVIVTWDAVGYYNRGTDKVGLSIIYILLCSYMYSYTYKRLILNF